MGLCSGDDSGASKQDAVPATRYLRFRWFGPDVRQGVVKQCYQLTRAQGTARMVSIRKVLERKHRFLLYPLLMNNVLNLF